MKKLPPVVERSVRESWIARLQLTDEFERKLLASTGAPVTCRKGCSHCCHYPVMLTVLEGIDLFWWLTKNHLWGHDLQQAFQRHAGITMGQGFQVWMLSMPACPLLDDKKLCIAFKRRPLVCRITVSRGDPHYCHPHRLGEGTQLEPRAPWLERHRHAEKVVLRQHKLAHIYLPLSVATLYGEKVCKESLDITDFDMQVLADFVKGMRDG